MTSTDNSFVLCINSTDAEDLEKGKVYRVVADAVAESEGMLRVVDDSQEDYLYPADYFVVLDLPQRARDALAA